MTSHIPISRGLTVQTAADLLQAFLKEESGKLKQFKLRHGPTIGAMYEGLSAEFLNGTLPNDLGLQGVSGFVVDHQGQMSGQVDCMLVRGVGEKIPHTDSYKWPIWDVLAVLEVKKTLTKAELRDSFFHLRGVYDCFRSWIDSNHESKNRTGTIAPANRAFEMMTGIHASRESLSSISAELRLLHWTLVAEMLSPVRIVLAYGGYGTEKGLRSALWALIVEAQQKGETRFGVPCFPQLITCNGISLVKASGQPYSPPMRDGKWDFLHSSRTNPVWIMLELIWAKISCQRRVDYRLIPAV